MNYIREAEQVLWYYKDLWRSISNMRKERAKLMRKNAPKDISAMSMDITGVRASSSDELLNILFNIKVLTENIEATEKELDKIDSELQELEKDEGCENFGKVLRLWYIEGLGKEEIAKELNYSERKSIYRLRDKAIRKFAIRKYGLNALIQIV